MNEVRVSRKGADRVTSGHPWIFSSDIADRDGAQAGHPVKVADEPAAGVEPAVADRVRQKLRQQASDPMAVLGVECLAASMRKDRDGVRRDELRLFQDRRGDLLTQLFLQLSGAFRSGSERSDVSGADVESDERHVHRSCRA